MVKFQEEERYYNTPYGRLPSVTTILSTVKKIPGPWYSKMAVNYLKDNLLDKLIDGSIGLKELRKMDLPKLMKYAKATAKRESDKAADVGSQVHELIEMYFKVSPGPGVVYYPLDLPTKPEIDVPYNAFLDWIDKNDVHCQLSEHKIYSRLGYAGTLDFIGMVNGRQYLVDFKSSKGFWPEMPMQIAAYAHAHHEMTHEDIEGAGILRLDKKTGMPEWREIPFDKLGHYLDKFLLLLNYWNLCKKDIDKW